jgi:mRNA interferase YafQ
MYKITTTNKYDKDLKCIIFQPKLIEEIDTVVSLLSTNDTPFPKKYNDHALKGKYATYRECHIRPDWLLIYKKTKTNLILVLVRTGTHSQLF